MPLDVCVIGEINPDLILYGVPEQLEPERETLVDGFRLTLGSSSAIFAHNLAVLGSRVGIVSKTGADFFGKLCLDILAEAEVDISNVSKSSTGALTGLSVILTKPEHRFILTYPGTMFDLCKADLNLDYVFSARHLHVASYFLQKSLWADLPDLFRQAKAKGLSTSLDTNDDPADRWQDVPSLLPFVDILFPNEREAKKLAGTNDLPRALRKLSQDCQYVVVKLGASGAIARHGSNEWRHDGISTVFVDPVGAGDSFDAGYIHRFLQEGTPAECLELACAAGAYSTTGQGGTEAFRNRANLEEFVRLNVSRNVRD